VPAEANRLLEQLTFGPNGALMTHIQSIGTQAFLNEQLAAAAGEYPAIKYVPNILTKVTLSSVMGDYLNMVNNDKPANGVNPNENYAPEVAASLFPMEARQALPICERSCTNQTDPSHPLSVSDASAKRSLRE
jgi:hypothetical protein